MKSINFLINFVIFDQIKNFFKQIGPIFDFESSIESESDIINFCANDLDSYDECG